MLDGIAIPAVSGPYADLQNSTEANIDVANPADPNKTAAVQQAASDGTLDTTYHVHPSGQEYPPKPMTSSVGTTISNKEVGPREYVQVPSPTDYDMAKNVKTKLGYHIVVAARDKQVHFYNGAGNKPIASMSLSGFVKIP